MRLLADENIPGQLVEALRNEGRDVAWVREDCPGSPDTHVLRLAVAESRVLITLDKDFGELAFRAKLPAVCGVILLRITSPTPAAIVSAAVVALHSRTDWAGHFSVIESDRVRMTPLPGTRQNGSPAD